MSNYRRALEGFVAAVQGAELDLEDLPEDFIETAWMQTQQSVHNQPIQLKVRVGALKQFLNWLGMNGIPCANLRYPEIKTPPPKPKEPQMNDVTMLGDPTLQADPVPATNTYVPPPAPQVQTAIPPPAPKSVAPKASSKNPLAALLPTGQYKLRVRREREMDEPVWVGDFPADRVAAAGAVEPFLGREAAPRMVAQGITGDVTFLVSPVAPNGQEVGERARMTISCVPPVAPVQSVAAPVAGAAPVTTGVSPTEMADMLAYHRRAQEELEERLSKKFEAQPKQQTEEKKPVANDEMSELKQMVTSLASTVRDLSNRLDDRADRSYDMPSTPAPQQPPQMDMLGVIREVMSFNKQMAPQPVQQPMGLAEVFNMMAQAKTMFAPAQVNIDVSPLEEQLADLRQQMAAQNKKKDEISETVEKFKALKELFGVVGGETSASKPTNSLGSALGNLLDKVVNNPAPLADAVERILSATAQMKAAANGAPVPPRPVQPQRPQLPEPLVKATEALLDAESAEETTLAAHEWLSMLTQIPPLQKAADRLTNLLREAKQTELTIYLRQVFTHLGFGEKATAQRVTQMVKDILAQVAEANAENEEEESDEEEGVPDLTVRVGSGARMEMSDEEEEAEYEESDEEDADEGDATENAGEAEESADEDAPADDTAVHEEAPAAGAVLDASVSEIQAALTEEPKKPRRKRRTKAQMAEARAAEAAAALEQSNPEPTVEA